MRIARLRAAAWVGAVFASWAAPALAQQPLLSLPDVAATIGSNDNTLELAFTAGTTPVRAFEVDMHTGPGSGRLSDVRYELYDPVTAGWAACPATLTQPGYSRSCSVAGQTATFAIGNTSSALPSASTGLARMVYDVSPGASAGTAVIQLSNASFVGLAGQPVAGNKDDGSITVGGGGDVAQLVAGGGPFNAPAADAPVGVAFFAGDSTARVSFELRYSGSGTAALSNRRFELFDPALPGWVACPASFSRSDAIARSCAVLGADRASYVFDAVVVPLPSLPQLARTRFDSASTAPTSFQVSLPSRDFRKPNGTPANGEHVEANVSLLNYVPELDYAPPPDALVSFATGLVGSNATSSIAVLLADGGQAPGEAMLSCSTAAPFSITGGGSQLLPAGQTPVDVGLSCVIGAGAVDGTLTCVESGNLFAPQRTRRWPLRCAAASAAPTLGYTPTAGTSIAFPGGILGGNASRTIAVGVSGGANAGAVSLTCAPSSAAFTLAPPTTFTAVPGAPGRDLVLGCTRTAAQQAASLDCVETDTPGGATRNRSWPLQCPAGDLAPTLTYAPAPGALSFPVVQRDTPSSLTITPTANGGVNAGSVALDCAVSQGFTLANGTQSVPVGGTPAALTLGCTPRAQALAGTLTCNEVDAPGGTARTRSWTLDCPVGTPGPA
ncbi:MAG TPA: hypothetical protein VFO79_07605, partial [Xanthomonadales bacterium]|nr:hypothetical protein [Xanthomonadales bacterium]